MKSKIIAISLLTSLGLASLPAHADITGGGVLGAIAGGLLGSQVGQGNGRIASSALGAVLGYNAGQSMSGQPYYAPPQQAYYPPQQTYYPPQGYYQPAPPVYYGPRGDDDGGDD